MIQNSVAKFAVKLEFVRRKIRLLERSATAWFDRADPSWNKPTDTTRWPLKAARNRGFKRANRGSLSERGTFVIPSMREAVQPYVAFPTWQRQFATPNRAGYLMLVGLVYSIRGAQLNCAH